MSSNWRQLIGKDHRNQRFQYATQYVLNDTEQSFGLWRFLTDDGYGPVGIHLCCGRHEYRHASGSVGQSITGSILGPCIPVPVLLRALTMHQSSSVLLSATISNILTIQAKWLWALSESHLFTQGAIFELRHRHIIQRWETNHDPKSNENSCCGNNGASPAG